MNTKIGGIEASLQQINTMFKYYYLVDFLETKFEGTQNMAFALTPELTFLIGVVIFWAVLYLLAVLLHLDKRGLDVKPGYFMYRSKSLNSSIDKLAKKQPTLWTILANMGIAFSVGLMILALYFLINNLLSFARPGGGGYFVPVVPGLTLSLVWLPFFAVAAIVVILPHELAHGIVSRLENIPVLSTGIVAVAVLFGAFVEPDEKEFEKASLTARLRMLAAGSSTNLVTALLTLLLLTGLFSPPAGVLIFDVVPNSPLANSRIPVQRWDVIQAVDGKAVYSYAQYVNYTRNVEPGQLLTLTILHANQRENITLVTVRSPTNSSRGIIGFQPTFISDYYPNRLGLDQYAGVTLYLTVFWIYLVAVSVAIFNMLPMVPFDGERVLYYPLEHFVKKRKRELRIGISAFTLGLFALNIILSLWRFGLFAI